jgi:hypothetical protein
MNKINEIKKQFFFMREAMVRTLTVNTIVKQKKINEHTC